MSSERLRWPTGLVLILCGLVLFVSSSLPLRAASSEGAAAEEHVLELVHAGAGEQQRRVVGRNQRVRGQSLVALALEEGEVAFADLCSGQGFHVVS